MSYINNMGGVKALEVNELIIELFNYCINRNINIQASHICGRLNTQADFFPIDLGIIAMLYPLIFSTYL